MILKAGKKYVRWVKLLYKKRGKKFWAEEVEETNLIEIRRRRKINLQKKLDLKKINLEKKEKVKNL